MQRSERWVGGGGQGTDTTGCKVKGLAKEHICITQGTDNSMVMAKERGRGPDRRGAKLREG